MVYGRTQAAVAGVIPPGPKKGVVVARVHFRRTHAQPKWVIVREGPLAELQANLGEITREFDAQLAKSETARFISLSPQPFLTDQPRVIRTGTTVIGCTSVESVDLFIIED